MHPKPRRARRTLVVIASLFAMSAALRIGIGIEEARARIPEGGLPISVATPARCEPAPEAVLEALSAREARVAALEASASDRMAALALAEKAAAEQVAALTAAEQALAATIALADSAAETDLARLTAVYETMRPKDAAALFEAMDPEFAAGFLGRMRPDAAAAILAGMTAASGYRVSLLLAARNANVPRD
jgi:flagellar motility protein MotE (MotC chaperone)